MKWEQLFFSLGLVIWGYWIVTYIISLAFDIKSPQIEIKRVNVNVARFLRSFIVGVLNAVSCFAAFNYGKLKYMWLIFGVVWVVFSLIDIMFILYRSVFGAEVKHKVKVKSIGVLCQSNVVSILLMLVTLFLWLYSWGVIFA